MPLPLAIVGGLTVLIVPMVVSVLLALGVGIVTYTGMDIAITEAETYIMSSYNTMPAAAVLIMNKAGILQGLNIFFAAWTASISIRVAMGAFTKIRLGAAA